MNRSYSLESLMLITGKLNPETSIEAIPEESLMLCEVIEQPQKLPFYIEAFYNMDIKEVDAFRFALMRIQIDSDLRMNEDIQKHQHRRYVARTIEKLLFSDILLEQVQGVVLEGE
jgi:hypothetical protein